MTPFGYIVVVVVYFRCLPLTCYSTTSCFDVCLTARICHWMEMTQFFLLIACGDFYFFLWNRSLKKKNWPLKILTYAWTRPEFIYSSFQCKCLIQKTVRARCSICRARIRASPHVTRLHSCHPALWRLVAQAESPLPVMMHCAGHKSEHRRRGKVGGVGGGAQRSVCGSVIPEGRRSETESH